MRRAINVQLSAAEAQQLLWLAQSVADYEDALAATIPHPAQRAAALRAIEKLARAIEQQTTSKAKAGQGNLPGASNETVDQPRQGDTRP